MVHFRHPPIPFLHRSEKRPYYGFRNPVKGDSPHLTYFRWTLLELGKIGGEETNVKIEWLTRLGFYPRSTPVGFRDKLPATRIRINRRVPLQGNCPGLQKNLPEMVDIRRHPTDNNARES